MSSNVEANNEEDPPETLMDVSDLWPNSDLMGHATRRQIGAILGQPDLSHFDTPEKKDWLAELRAQAERSDALRTQLSGGIG